MTERTASLEQRLWKRFNQGLSEYGLLSDGDRILVGLSGGKDSLALLELLARRARIFRPKIEVLALHVRMENIDYESDTSYLEDFASRLGVPLYIRTTGYEASTDRRKTPCFLCSWYRRKVLFNVAQELGCNKLALGHHQDDILRTALMNLTFQGQFDSMPASLRMRKFPLTIIRPLCLVPEADLVAWAEERDYQPQRKRCPHERDSQRTDIQQVYEAMMRLNPDVRASIWNALHKAGKTVEG